MLPNSSHYFLATNLGLEGAVIWLILSKLPENHRKYSLQSPLHGLLSKLAPWKWAWNYYSHRTVALGWTFKIIHSHLYLNRWTNGGPQKPRNLFKITHWLLDLELEPRHPAPQPWVLAVKGPSLFLGSWIWNTVNGLAKSMARRNKV